ncbi:MAG TPA: hypothetical protein VMB71_13540, partial [Acetobacteraceae bacterium]|nr:hypothetical protein [Acetobacteraceae bacterium]
MADALATLARLRRLATDAARRQLAAAVAAERAAADRLNAARAAVTAEARAAPTDAAHPLAGSFALWLPASQAARVA